MVDTFCYLGDLLDTGGGAESSSITRVSCDWKMFRDLLPLLGSSAMSLKVKGKIYRECVRPVLLYRNEVWPSLTGDKGELDRK